MILFGLIRSKGAHVKLPKIALCLATICTMTLFAADPEVIAIGIGPKNPTLDEKIFKNIKVFYVPSISVTEGAVGAITYSGEPQFLTQWFSKDGSANDFLVIGSNGVVYDQGKSIIAGVDMIDVETERKGSFAKTAWALAEKNRTLNDNKKPINVSDPDGFIRRKLPSFKMINPEGAAVDSKSIFENGRAKLVIFFYLKPSLYIGAEKDEGAAVRSKEYMKGRLESSAGTEGVRALIQTERELFGNIIHDIY